VAWWRTFPPRTRKQWFFAVVLVLLALVRIVRPDTKIDATTIWLVCLAAFLLLFSDLTFLLSYLEKVKVGPAEFSLRKDAISVESDLAKVQPAVAALEDHRIIPQTPDILARAASLAAHDPRAALMFLSAETERLLRKKLATAGLPESARPASLAQMVSAAVRAGLIPQGLEQPSREFSAVRNRVVHGDATEISNATLQLVFSVATDLFRTLAVEPKPDVLIACEGRIDQVVLSSIVTFAARAAQKQIVPQFVVGGGKDLVPKALARHLEPYVEIAYSLPKKLLIVLDSDTEPQSKLTQRQDDILSAIRQLPGDMEVKIIFAVPSIESWVGEGEQTRDLHRIVASVDWEARSQGIPELHNVLTFLRS